MDKLILIIHTSIGSYEEEVRNRSDSERKRIVESLIDEGEMEVGEPYSYKYIEV